MIFYDMLPEGSAGFGKLTNSYYFKNLSFSLLLASFKIIFKKEYLRKYIYLRFLGSHKPSCGICYVLFSTQEKKLEALLLFHRQKPFN